MDRNAAFWDRLATKYAAQPISDMQAYKHTLERTRHWLRPDMSVLEVGCGTGTIALELADAVAAIRGTDLSQNMVEIAKAKASEAGVNHVHFVQSSAQGAGEGEEFDAILGFNVLHLLEDLPSTLSTLRARLPKGGLLITKTPCLASKAWLRPLIWGMQMIGRVARPVHTLSAARIEELIQGAGFEIEETHGYPGSIPKHFIVARAT